MPKWKKWHKKDDITGAPRDDIDPTTTKHDPYWKKHGQREYVQNFQCECCKTSCTVRGADKIAVEQAILNLRRHTGGHELCDPCIAAGVRHFNLKERRALYQKTGNRK